MSKTSKNSKTLQKVQATKEKYTPELKAYMTKCNELEYKALMIDCRKKFVKSLRLLAQNVLIYEKEEEDTDTADKLSVSILKKYEKEMLHYLDTDLKSIFALYKSENSITELPTPMDTSPS